ncbi:peptidase C39 family protein, partial [Candidatus Woesearchaeota archaeon]|nr:peptidase C39 family protein [Candidatus Woesearchaeota archaeon]
MKPYIQTTKYTCASASLAMIINHFRDSFLLNAENEFDIWQKTATLPTRGSSIYGLASYAHGQGIPLKVVVGTHEYKFPGYKFKSYKKQEILIANFSSELFYKKAKESDIRIEERSFSLDEVKDELKAGKVLLLRLVIGIIRTTKLNRRNPH